MTFISKKTIAFLLAAGLMVSLCGCGSSADKEQVKKLKSKNEKLSDEIDELKDEIDELKEENESLKVELQNASIDVPTTPDDPVDPDDPSDPPKNGDILIGISLPTKMLQRWVTDGDCMKADLEAKGYEVDLIYADNDVSTQISQIDLLIEKECDVLVVAPIDGYSLVDVLEKAEEKNIPVISYDRLIMESDAIDYYVTFDNYMAGMLQGEYIRDQLDLDGEPGPFNIEFTAGDPTDTNAYYFYIGAFDVLKPYIDSGKLVVQSGQKDFDVVATDAWRTDQAQERAENIIAAFYSDGEDIDAWLCSNDSTALGITNALENYYVGKYPIITGMDCDIANVKNIIKGKQSMSVFKDTRTLADQTAYMVTEIIEGKTVDVNDTKSYNNGVKDMKSFLCMPVFVTVDNYEVILIDGGYYDEATLS